MASIRFAVSATLGFVALGAVLGLALAQDRFVVIRNINAPHDCQVVPSDATYITIYAQVFGPAAERAARDWARKNCAPQSR